MPKKVVYTTNPLTGRRIIVGGPTYKKLQEMKVKIPSKTSTGDAPSKSAPDKKMNHSHLQKLKRLSKAKVLSKGSRGWKDRKPNTISQRNQLYQECGDGCFLYVGSNKKNKKELKFPICQKCGAKKCPCKVDCGGLTAAKVRAAQWKYNHTKQLADQIADHYGWYHDGKISCR